MFLLFCAVLALLWFCKGVEARGWVMGFVPDQALGVPETDCLQSHSQQCSQSETLKTYRVESEGDSLRLFCVILEAELTFTDRPVPSFCELADVEMGLDELLTGTETLAVDAIICVIKIAEVVQTSRWVDSNTNGLYEAQWWRLRQV